MLPKAINKIILIDDDADDRNIFGDAFRELKMDTELQIFSDGTELMEHLKSTCELPQLLFLDLNMPKKSGFECLQEIRSDAKFRNISIAIYSTSSSPREIEATYKEGADLYIQKPNDYSKLKKVIREVVHKKWRHYTSGFNRETFLMGI